MASRVVHLRGWAPYGAHENSKLTRIEADALHRDMEKHFDEWLVQKTNWRSPFMKKHTVSLEVLDCGAGEAKRAAYRINLVLNDKQIQARGGIPRTAKEASPGKRAKLKFFFHAKDRFAKSNAPEGWLVCGRGLELEDRRQDTE